MDGAVDFFVERIFLSAGNHQPRLTEEALCPARGGKEKVAPGVLLQYPGVQIEGVTATLNPFLAVHYFSYVLQKRTPISPFTVTCA